MNVKNYPALKKALDKKLPYYVLITCSEPSEDGQMEVEMTYKGHQDLASFLIQEAQFYINPEEDQSLAIQLPLNFNQ